MQAGLRQCCALALALAAAPGALAQEAAGFSVMVPSSPMPAASEPIYLSPWAGEIVKLAQAGVEDGVTLSFVTNSAGVFNLGADQIIVLRDLGVSDAVINKMIEHDRELNTSPGPIAASTVPMPSVAPLTRAPSATDGAIEATRAAIREWNARLAAASPVSVPASPVAPPPQPALSFASVGAEAQASEVENPLAGLDMNEAPDLGAVAPLATGEEALEAQGQTQVSRGNAYPIREPYPMQLTVPILMFRAAVRAPNLQIILPLH